MTLPPELLEQPLKWLDPLSLKRYSVASKAHRALILDYFTSDAYGRELAMSAAARLRQLLHNAHGQCFNERVGGRLKRRQQAPLFALGLDRHFDNVQCILSGTAKPIPEWNRDELLAFLWPVAIHCHAIWLDCLHTLEWCARYGDPHDEVLALFERDALPRLVRVAARREWPVGSTLAAVAETMCRTATAGLIGIMSKQLEDLVTEAIVHARAPGDTSFCLAVRAAARAAMPDYTGHRVPARPLAAAMLGRCQILAGGYRATCPPADALWIHRAGLIDDSKRNPLSMLNAAGCPVCRPGLAERLRRAEAPRRQYTLGEMFAMASEEPAAPRIPPAAPPQLFDANTGDARPDFQISTMAALPQRLTTAQFLDHVMGPMVQRLAFEPDPALELAPALELDPDLDLDLDLDLD